MQVYLLFKVRIEGVVWHFCGKKIVWVDSFSKFHIDALINGGTNEVWRFTSFYG